MAKVSEMYVRHHGTARLHVHENDEIFILNLRHTMFNVHKPFHIYMNEAKAESPST